METRIGKEIKSIIKEAYREGLRDGHCVSHGADELWKLSESKKVLRLMDKLKGRILKLFLNAHKKED